VYGRGPTRSLSGLMSLGLTGIQCTHRAQLPACLPACQATLTRLPARLPACPPVVYPPLACAAFCSKVVAQGAEDEVRAALQGIEREVSGVLGGLPLYEPLFQLMCHGVPHGECVYAAAAGCSSSSWLQQQ
jgi:hypothetical protein